MNYGDLVASVTSDLWPFGPQENLLATHAKMFVQAMAELQNNVPCFRHANQDFFPQCATYFNCGMTVLPQPNGQVYRIYTIGKQSYKGAKPGSAVGSISLTPQLVELVNGVLTYVPLSGVVATADTTGLYTVNVSQTNPKNTLFPFQSPQYFRTAITYTDASGVQHTIQPAPLIHMNDNQQSGSLAIDCLAGTDITYSITAFNQPQTSGSINVAITVTAGSLLSDQDDWCSKVYYEQIEYAYIERYVRACSNCNANNLWAVANAVAANLFGSWRDKRRYIPPTDIGFENLPPLPHGFHYPQTSTDAGGRSRGGVFAIKHGRIYIAPWIESSESGVVEWDG